MDSVNTTNPTIADVLKEANAKGLNEGEKRALIGRHLSSKAYAKGIPINGALEITPLCNLDCKMCYVHLEKHQMKERRMLDGKTWINLIDQACEAGLMYLRLTGGECLTHPDFWDIYHHLCTCGVETTILTNGLLITEDAIEEFSKYKPACIQLSVYGCDDDSYERVTGYRVFNKVKKAIDGMIAAGIPLSLAMTPSRFTTREDGERLISFLNSYGPQYKLNLGLVHAREETGRRFSEFDILLDDYIYFAKLDAANKGYEVNPVCDGDVPAIGTGTSSDHGIVCGAGRNGFCIGWYGMMYGCNALMEFSAPVLEIGFAAAWKSINEAACAFPLPMECQGCSCRSVCKICAVEHLQGAELGHANPAVCERLRRRVLEGLLPLPNGAAT